MGQSSLINARFFLKGDAICIYDRPFLFFRNFYYRQTWKTTGLQIKWLKKIAQEYETRAYTRYEDLFGQVDGCQYCCFAKASL
jgi:hypothetical protein